MSLPGITNILLENKNEFTWVCSLSETATQEVVKLQPGKYRAVFRGKNIRETLFTIEKIFIVEPGTSMQVLLK